MLLRVVLNIGIPAMILLCLLFTSGSAASGVSATSATKNLLDAKFSPLDEGAQPGVAVMLVADGEILLQESYGLANVETRTPIDPDTAFRLASVSKQFTAMAILMLQEDGALSLDDPIKKYVPELAPYPGVTIRHLLLHTGGLPDYYDEIGAGGDLVTNAEAAVLIAEMASPVFEPGEKFEYSNAGYDMLGPVAEAAAGMPLSEFMRERMFRPLGMENSLLHDHRRPAIPNRAYGYDVSEGVPELHDEDTLNGVVGSGGVYSSLNDLYLWAMALHDGRLVSEVSLQQMFTSGRSASGDLLDYGLGWNLDQLAGFDRQDHSGSWVGFRTYIGRIPEKGLTLVMLSNRSDIVPREHVDAILTTYLIESLGPDALHDLESDVFGDGVSKCQQQACKDYAAIH